MRLSRMGHAYISFVVKLFALALPDGATAQSGTAPQAGDQFKIEVEVNMVTVPVTVRSLRGILNDQPRNAFPILEDGREEEIVALKRESGPQRVALVLGTSEGVKKEWPDVADTTRQLIHSDKMVLLRASRYKILRKTGARVKRFLVGSVFSLLPLATASPQQTQTQSPEELLWRKVRKVTSERWQALPKVLPARLSSPL